MAETPAAVVKSCPHKAKMHVNCQEFPTALLLLPGWPSLIGYTIWENYPKSKTELFCLLLLTVFVLIFSTLCSILMENVIHEKLETSQKTV